MRIYLAGRFSRREELRDYAMALQILGHTVVSSWLFREPEFEDDGITMRGEEDALQAAALMDLMDVEASEVFILFSEEPGFCRGGRMVEFGVAIGCVPWLLICGPRENLFTWLPEVRQCANWGEVLAVLPEIEEATAAVQR